MRKYYPDKWVVVKVGENLYKVFATWYGGVWKLNSGITKVTKEDDVYSFVGSSGSVYYCHEDARGISMFGLEVLGSLSKTPLPIVNNFMELTYE